MSIISAFKNNLLKTRVIGLSCNFQIVLFFFLLDHADKVLTQLVKGDFENPDEYFFSHDAMKYYVKKIKL